MFSFGPKLSAGARYVKSGSPICKLCKLGGLGAFAWQLRFFQTFLAPNLLPRKPAAVSAIVRPSTVGDKRTGYGASQGFTTGTPALS